MITGLLGLAIMVATDGCGGSALGNGSVHVLPTDQAKRALLELPYEYTFRQHVPLPRGATGAIAGRAVDSHNMAINFGIALGEKPEAGVPVPRSGIKDAYGYGGFIYTNDLEVPNGRGGSMINPRFRTTKEWHHAADINVAITEKLCRAETGKPCHEG